MPQLDLFAAPEEPDLPELAADRELAARLPGHVRFGTSSWTFPGWSGLLYPHGTTERDLRERGLRLYSRSPLFRTVGIDRSYYRPLTRPELEDYAAQLPDGFRCVMKVWSEITSRVRGPGREPNPEFLNPALFQDAVFGPVREAFREHEGPFVFELAPLRDTELPRPGELPDLLSRFFEALPRDAEYAVELRNRELFTPRYLKVLAALGVAHTLNFWERMPTLGEQLAAPGVLTAGFAVARLLIPPGERYAEKKAEFAPFDRIVEPQPELREDVARLAEAVRARGSDLYVIVNNKVEGSSPLTVRALARRIVEGPTA